MKVYICDRCGEVYTDNKKFKTRGRINGSIISGVYLKSKYEEIDAAVDLCDECIKDFFDFSCNKTVYKREKVKQA